jgi:hypothetical protein
MSDETDEDVYNDNAYVNELTLNFLISKTQLNKLNKLKQKDVDSKPTYDKDRIYELFNQLLNNNKPDDLLEDVKVCFDAFIEKSIYYLEIHDKNKSIQNERIYESNEDALELDEDEDEEEEDINNDIEDEFFEEPEPEIVKKINTKYSKKNISNGVDDIHKLPLDWFNTTRQNYKQNQIIPRKKEIIIDNSSSKKI